MLEKSSKNNEKGQESMKKKFLEERERAQMNEVNISETGLQRMNGPIGLELTENEWNTIKMDEIAENKIKKNNA